jgi:CAAX protease family protein
MSLDLRDPELPDAARPRWPAWHAPAAMFSALIAMFFFLPALPLILLSVFSDTLSALSLLILVVIQDATLVGAAVMFASRTIRPEAWHFGLRPTRLWPTVGLVALSFGLLFGIEVGWFELLGVDDASDEDLDTDNALASFLISLAVIVVAPVTEEFFFRAFFYRALRTRMPIRAAATIDGVVFASIHLQYYTEPLILPVIALFGVVQCLVYERTGSLFAVIAIHAAFNTVASLSLSPLPAIVVGAFMLLACVLVPRQLRRSPSPVPA